MNKVLWFLLATVLPAVGVGVGTAASAAPLPVIQVQSPEPAVQKARWVHRVDCAGRRSRVWLGRHGRKRAVSSNPNVERPDRPVNQAGWGQMPGGPRRYGQ